MPTIKVIAAVLEKDGLILIAQRKEGEYQGGKWEFPGGKIEKGETPEECLKRELKEELGLETEIGEFICSGKHIYPHISIELMVYEARHLSGEATAKDHQQIKWISPQALPGYDFLEADLPVIAKLLK